VYVTTPEGAVVAELYGYLGRASNNVAEYQALIHALKYALDRGARRVKVFSDSELVVRQISGQYRVKHADMIPLHGKARGLLARFEEASVSHVRREQNKDADRLANQALDEKASKLE
jgi:ribonuclease HI